jgi:hypothetical protein
MNLQKSFIPTVLIISTLLVHSPNLECGSRVFIAQHPLPNVSLQMEKPEFWIKRIQNPTRLLLKPEEIKKMNEEHLNRKDLFLCRLKDLKEEWTKDEILSLHMEDWEQFGKTGEVRYRRYGYPLEETFWRKLKDNLNQESLKEKNRILLGLIVKRTDIRVFPTDEVSMSTPNNYEFDRFQHSSISPGSPIGIYHYSRDKRWAYVQTGFIRGWVHTKALAIAQERNEVVDYEETKERLVMTGSFINVFGDPTLQQVAFLAQMGSSFPIFTKPINTGMIDPCYIIKIPFREIDGRLTFRKGYIRKSEDVHEGFLPYNQENVGRQAFKMLHQPYGWGEMFGARDCSRFIMDIFSTFGILMPRNSQSQAMVGINLGQLEGKTVEEKQKALDQAIPLVTLLRLPGHIMLYLGKENGRYYVIHNIWGIQRAGWFGPVLKKIGKCVVSDLSLGRSGPNGSLLQRITDIRLIGPPL